MGKVKNMAWDHASEFLGEIGLKAVKGMLCIKQNALQ